MGPLKSATQHGQPKRRPTPTRQALLNPTYGPDPPASGVEPYQALQRYLGNSFMQFAAAGKVRPTESAAQFNPQPEPTVGRAGDICEQEADRVANQVMAGSAPVTAIGISPRLQRFSIQPQGQGAAAPESEDQALAGPGRPLEPGLREEMEQRFNADFSAVRIHTDTRAHVLARALQARAFTIGHHVAFGVRRYAPDTGTGKRLLAHELAHVMQQTSASLSPTGLKSRPAVQLSPEETRQEIDPWSKLSLKGQQRAQALYNECWDLIGRLNDAQAAHVSLLRSRWLKFLSSNVLVRIGNLDDDRKIYGLTNVLADFSDSISRNVANFYAEWESVERRYLDEHGWLMRLGSADATEAAKYLENVYTDAKGRLDRGALVYITDEDYLTLKQALEQARHVSVGVLRASRGRVKQLFEMLDVVAQLRMDGVDAEKYLPGWSAQVQNEADMLERLAGRTRPTTGFDYPAEFRRLRRELLERRSATLKYHKRKKPIIEKGAEFVAGAAEAVVGPLVEAAKEAVDLAQINLHIVSFGKYEPKFISDMAKAAEQGATTSDLLKGMVTGLLETPSRFLKAVEDGDWEAIGRESVNLYLLAKAIKETPGQFRKVPELVAKTRRGLRILKARTLRTTLNEPRLVPPAPPAPPAPSPHVAGFARGGEPALLKPVEPPGPSPRVEGFGRDRPPPRPSTEPQGPLGEAPPQPSKRVSGFARSRETLPDAPHGPSPRVSGFARGHEPAPAQPGPPVDTRLPPARHLPSSAAPSHGPEIIGKRPGEPPKAMAEKPPKPPPGRTAPTVVRSSGGDPSVDIRSIVSGEIKVPRSHLQRGGQIASEPKVILHNEAPAILYELPDGTRLVTVRNGKPYYMSLGKSKTRVGGDLTVKEAGSFYEFAGAQEMRPTPIPNEFLNKPKFADTIENLRRIDKGWLIKGPGLTETNPVSGLLEHTYRLANRGQPLRSPAELNAWLSANGAAPITDLFRDVLKWTD